LPEARRSGKRLSAVDGVDELPRRIILAPVLGAVRRRILPAGIEKRHAEPEEVAVRPRRRLLDDEEELELRRVKRCVGAPRHAVLEPAQLELHLELEARRPVERHDRERVLLHEKMRPRLARAAHAALVFGAAAHLEDEIRLLGGAVPQNDALGLVFPREFVPGQAAQRRIGQRKPRRPLA